MGTTLTADVKEFSARRYLAGCTPADLVHEIREQFGLAVTAASLRQYLSRAGISARRRAIANESTAEFDTNQDRPAPTEPSIDLLDAKAQLLDWAEKARQMAEKSFNNARNETNARSLAQQIAAAKTAVGMYQDCLEGLGVSSNAAATYNYNFNAFDPNAPENRSAQPVTVKQGL